MLIRWWKTVDNSKRKKCGDCPYFHWTVCGYFDQFANADDYACHHVNDEPPNYYDYEP